MPRRILIANATLGGTSGTEIVTRDLALGLTSRGHHVAVYTPTFGPLADELIAAGIAVTSDLDQLPQPPDLVHGHHHLQTVDALTRFPQSRGVFVCHDRRSPHAIPPKLDRIRRFIAVDDNCLERLRDEWQIPPALTRVILNAVDTQRVGRRGPLPSAPRRALIFSHNASLETHEYEIRRVCGRLGITVEVMGTAAGTASLTPERMLGQYDLVFAKARCALEALATGAAVVLCDAAGLGPMVTRADLSRLRAWNFGARLLESPLDPDALLRELERYDPADAAAVTDVIRDEASLTRALDRYEGMYDEVLSDDFIPSAAWTRGLVEPLISRVADLEHQLRICRRPDRMQALTDDALASIHLTIEAAPGTMEAGASVFVRLRLRNDLADQAIGPWAPFPVTCTYRWRRESAPGFAGDEEEHIGVPAVPPGTSSTFSLNVTAPREPGRFVLRATLIQESLRWLDAAAVPVCADLPVLVTGSAILKA